MSKKTDFSTLTMQEYMELSPAKKKKVPKAVVERLMEEAWSTVSKIKERATRTAEPLSEGIESKEEVVTKEEVKNEPVKTETKESAEPSVQAEQVQKVSEEEEDDCIPDEEEQGGLPLHEEVIQDPGSALMKITGDEGFANSLMVRATEFGNTALAIARANPGATAVVCAAGGAALATALTSEKTWEFLAKGNPLRLASSGIKRITGKTEQPGITFGNGKQLELPEGFELPDKTTIQRIKAEGETLASFIDDDMLETFQDLLYEQKRLDYKSRGEVFDIHHPHDPPQVPMGFKRVKVNEYMTMPDKSKRKIFVGWRVKPRNG